MGNAQRYTGRVTSRAADPQLPVWPAPSWERVGSAEDLASLVSRLDAARPGAIGVWVQPTRGRHAHDPDDYRGTEAARIAIATGDTDPVQVIDVPAAGDLEPLRRWLASEHAPYVVMHGAQAAVHRLQPASHDPDVWSPSRLGCTHVAAVLLASAVGRRRSTLDLPDCAERVLEHRLPAGAARRGGEDLFGPAAEEAAATSASTLLPLMRAITPMLRRLELTPPFELECQLVPAVVAMERVGFGIDGAAFQRIADGWSRERADATDPDRITRLDKLLSTYAHWPRDFVRGGRIHCRLHPLAAESGRFSCTDPNLQQVPGQHTAPGLRACFVPAPGHRLVVADYAQIELRVAAHLAPCESLQAVFNEGRDAHRATAATITGKAEDAISGHERKLAKAVNFGFLFGMGARRFAEYARDSYGVELDGPQAQRAREAFLGTFPGIARWHRRVGALGRRGEAVTVRTALGRRKRFADKVSFNAALNIPVQGTAAEGFKRAMVELHPRLRAIGARGVLVVHDEYIAEVPDDRAEDGRRIVEDTMREAMASVVTSVPIEVEAELCDHWG